MGRPSDARGKILEAAASLLEHRGYSALGVAEICKAARVPKGSFYYYFDSKEALVMAVIDEHWAARRDEWIRILGGDAAPLLRLRQLFEETEADQRSELASRGTVSGCLFGNLTLEMSNHTEALRVRLQQIFDAEVEMVEAVVAEADALGQISIGDTHSAARSVVAQLEGQVMFAKLYNNTGHLTSLWSNCLALLGADVAAAHRPALVLSDRIR
jgi:TetR/AcrR family transcriptional repressor of nem operon